MKLKSINPSKNYEILGEVEVSTVKEIKEAVEKANKAQYGWKGLDLKRRVSILRSVFADFEDYQEELAQLTSKEMGMPITEAREDIEFSIAFLNWYGEHAEKYLSPEVTYEDDNEIHTVYREPYGVAAVIVPWNFPMSNFVWQCGQNLVAGNTIVFKPSEEVPLFGEKLKEIFAESSLPEGVFNVVQGDGTVGDTLVHQDIDLICFTGSSEVGHYLYEVAAEKFVPVRLELGGSAPGIIFEDADLEKVHNTVLLYRFMNCGQVCDGLKRLLVHKSRFDEVVSKVVEGANSMKVGDALDEETEMGPLVAKRQLKVLEKQVKNAVEKGAKVLVGGRRPKGLEGAYYLPTVITDVTKDMRVWKEEVFGPVLPVVPFNNVEEAIELANDTNYGLGGYVFTEDKELFERVATQVETGMISLNNVSYIRGCNPFGGYKNSGLGREHGKYGFEDVTQIKIVSREK